MKGIKIMKYETLVPQIMELLGKEENVKSLVHCSTRLRFKIYDMNLVDLDKLKSLDGIAGVKVQSDGVQLIVGQDVDEAYDIIVKNYTFGSKNEKETIQAETKTKKKENILVQGLGWIADCLVPMLPALIASGLTTAIITVLSSFGLISTEGMTYQILDAIADGVLAFIPMFVVYGAAKKLEVNPMISFAVMGVLLYSNLWSLAGEDTYLTLFGFMPIRVFSYSNTIFPPILCVLTQKYVEKFIKKICPKMLQIFLEPLLTFLIVVLMMLVVFGPIGAYIGDALGNLIIAGSVDYAWLICIILAGFGNFLVGSGMHYCMIPAVIMIFSQLGYDTFYGGACMAGAFALAGSVLAVSLKTKNSKVRQVSLSTGTTALIGVSEPAIYGVFFKYKSVMIADCIAGAISGLISGLLGVQSYGMAPAGLFSIMNFAGETFVNLIIVITVAFVLGGVLTFIMYSDEKEGVEVAEVKQ